MKMTYPKLLQNTYISVMGPWVFAGSTINTCFYHRSSSNGQQCLHTKLISGRKIMMVQERKKKVHWKQWPFKFFQLNVYRNLRFCQNSISGLTSFTYFQFIVRGAFKYDISALGALLMMLMLGRENADAILEQTSSLIEIRKCVWQHLNSCKTGDMILMIMDLP